MTDIITVERNIMVYLVYFPFWNGGNTCAFGYLSSFLLLVKKLC